MELKEKKNAACCITIAFSVASLTTAFLFICGLTSFKSILSKFESNIEVVEPMGGLSQVTVDAMVVA